MLACARAFFAERHIIEVDPGALVKYPPNDSNVEVISTDQDNRFLHTSPEYAMKRLLSEGIGDCYFLGHVYRKGEVGSRHNPEFTMAEWYRCHISFPSMIQETADFLSLFFGPLPLQLLSYREAFLRFAKIDYSAISLSRLQQLTQSSWPRETCLDYLLTDLIEPHLGQNCLTALIDFPPEQAALSTLLPKNGETVAERYEIYYRGIELCNGYHELSDAEELTARFEKKNEERIKEGKAPYPLDGPFLLSMKTLPDCCGVALGFDRALMLRHNLPSIKGAIP